MWWFIKCDCVNSIIDFSFGGMLFGVFCVYIYVIYCKRHPVERRKFIQNYIRFWHVKITDYSFGQDATKGIFMILWAIHISIYYICAPKVVQYPRIYINMRASIVYGLCTVQFPIILSVRIHIWYIIYLIRYPISITKRHNEQRWL